MANRLEACYSKAGGTIRALELEPYRLGCFFCSLVMAAARLW